MIKIFKIHGRIQHCCFVDDVKNVVRFENIININCVKTHFLAHPSEKLTYFSYSSKKSLYTSYTSKRNKLMGAMILSPIT